MANLMHDVDKMCIRSDLNTMFATSKFIVTVLDTADTLPLARDTLLSMSEALMVQAADVYGRILRCYDSEPEGAFLTADESGEHEACRNAVSA